MIYGIWTFCAALLAFIISAVTGKFLIPYLRKLHFGQTILEEGPKWHKGKQGTPTMGGIMFIVAIVVVTMISTVIYAFTGADLVNSFFADIPRECMFIFCGLGLAVANGFIGFIDDYIKVVKKRNLGLTAPQKLILQFLVAAAFLAVLAIAFSPKFHPRNKDCPQTPAANALVSRVAGFQSLYDPRTLSILHNPLLSPPYLLVLYITSN